MMDFIHKVFSLIDWTMTTPPSYGLFHIISFILVIIVTVLISRSLKENPDRVVRNTVLGFTIITLVFEVMKQGLFTHEGDGYQWYIFPFQFCSIPMYVSLLSLIIKNQKVKEALYSFLAFYGLFGGLIVMIYPNDVFTYLVMINIQTMVHHGGMLVLGAILILANKVRFDFKSFLSASIVFICLVATAQIFNFIAYFAEVGTFNMFFISPFGENHFPILSTIQQTQPYFVFLICYLIGFALAAFIVQKLGYVFHLITNYVKTNQKVKLQSGKI